MPEINFCDFLADRFTMAPNLGDGKKFAKFAAGIVCF
jgi:hypothetical protein